MVGDKPIGDSLEMAYNSQCLIIKQGKKRASEDIIDVEETSWRQSTHSLVQDTSSRLKKVHIGTSDEFHLFQDFIPHTSYFSFWSPSFPYHQRGDKLPKSDFDHHMFKVAGATSMYKWIKAISMRSYTLAYHLELREHVDGKASMDLKEETSKLKSAHAKEV